MTKSELKQKLEAVRDELMKFHNLKYASLEKLAYENGYNTLLPLLLDAYEALFKSQKITSNDESYEIPRIKKALARIEAFANGEK